MGRSAYEALGISHEKAEAMAQEFDEMDRRAMVEVAPSFSLDIPATENQPYIDKVKEIRGPWTDKLRDRMLEIMNAPDQPKAVGDES